MSKSLENLIKALKESKTKSLSDHASLIKEIMEQIAPAFNMLQLKEISNKIDELKNLILLKKISEIEPAFGMKSIVDEDVSKGIQKLKTPIPESTKENKEGMLIGLRKVVANRVNPKTKIPELLLHKPTENLEYDKSVQDTVSDQPMEENPRITDFAPKEKTVWVTNFINAEKYRQNGNPVISCWIPEKNVIKVLGQNERTATWDSLSRDPQENLIRVEVEPGTYDIYQEIKG